MFENITMLLRPFFFRKQHFFLLSLLGILCCLDAYGKAVFIPKLQHPIHDEAGLLRLSDRKALEAILSAHKEAYGDEIAVLILADLEDEIIEDLAVKVFEQWGLGKAQKDNGILLLIAMTQKKVRIEVGYGLEDRITDIQAKRLIRETLQPYFREKRYRQGLEKTLYALCHLALQQRDLATEEKQSLTQELPYLFLLVLVFALFLVLAGGGGGVPPSYGRRDRAYLPTYLPPYRGSSGSSWGGGGRSGGGGASGGW